MNTLKVSASLLSGCLQMMTTQKKHRDVRTAHTATHTRWPSIISSSHTANTTHSAVISTAEENTVHTVYTLVLSIYLSICHSMQPIYSSSPSIHPFNPSIHSSPSTHIPTHPFPSFLPSIRPIFYSFIHPSIPSFIQSHHSSFQSLHPFNPFCSSFHPMSSSILSIHPILQFTHPSYSFHPSIHAAPISIQSLSSSFQSLQPFNPLLFLSSFHPSMHPPSFYSSIHLSISLTKPSIHPIIPSIQTPHPSSGTAYLALTCIMRINMTSSLTVIQRYFYTSVKGLMCNMKEKFVFC